MPNITYIKFTRNFFNATNGQLPYSAIAEATTNVSNAYPDNVILLIEEHNTGADENGFHFKSTTSVTFMILAWAFMLIGFTLCWCFQLFEKQKTQAERAGSDGRSDRCSSNRVSGSVSENHRSETLVLEQTEGSGRCFVLDGGDLDDDTESRSDRTNNVLDPADVIRRYDLDVESLPSYTIVSGLPTYDDALEEFRKAGLILKPPLPVVKIFDSETKEPPTYDGLPDYTASDSDGSTPCACGAAPAMHQSQIIELNPEHLKILSQKRLSLQIAFSALPTTIRRNSRPRIDLLQQVSRNNLLRAQRDREVTPEIHRSSSMTFEHERSVIEQRLRSLEHHRGSIS